MMFSTSIALNEYKKEALTAASILHCTITVHTALEFYPWYIETLPMVYRTPYLWYSEPHIHGILIPLHIVF